MKKIKTEALMFVALIMGFLFFSTPSAFPGQIIIKSDDQFSFARTCLEKGEYNRAAWEFERFIQFFPDDPLVPLARIFVGVSYLRDQRPKDAIKIFSKIIKSNPDSPIAGKALFFTGECYYQQGIFKKADYYFHQVIEKYPSSDHKNAALYRLGWTKMEENRWQDASVMFSKVEKEDVSYESAQELARKSIEGESLLLKSPATAGTLAAIVPGLGHAYVSRYKDAAVAFLLNGLFVWAAVESFHKDQHVLGGILSFLEIGWYTGNIYSAVNVAHKHNRKVRSDFRNNLMDRLDLHLLTSKNTPIGLALTFKF